MEFYFKSEDLLKLLNQNAEAKGVIISQEILPKNGPRGSRANMVLITARVAELPGRAKSKAKKVITKTLAEVFGCPYPPGCTI